MNDAVNHVSQHVASYNWVDYTILAIVAASILVAFLRGFIREAISLAVWVVAVFVSVKFAGPLSDYMGPYISSELVRYLIAFFALFLVSMLFGVLVNMMMRSVIERAGMSATDRMLGIFFGAARGVLVVAVMLMFVSVSPLESSPLVEQSALIPKFKGIVGVLDDFLPNQMKHLVTWLNNSGYDSSQVSPQLHQHLAGRLSKASVS